MKQITMFIMEGCPFCRRALKWMAELEDEYPEFKSADIKIIDEQMHRDIAAAYDYYFVPSYYVDGKKVHEGAASKQIIEDVYRAALE